MKIKTKRTIFEYAVIIIIVLVVMSIIVGPSSALAATAQGIGLLLTWFIVIAAIASISRKLFKDEE